MKGGARFGFGGMFEGASPLGAKCCMSSANGANDPSRGLFSLALPDP